MVEVAERSVPERPRRSAFDLSRSCFRFRGLQIRWSRALVLRENRLAFREEEQLVRAQDPTRRPRLIVRAPSSPPSVSFVSNGTADKKERAKTQNAHSPPLILLSLIGSSPFAQPHRRRPLPPPLLLQPRRLPRRLYILSILSSSSRAFPTFLSIYLRQNDHVNLFPAFTSNDGSVVETCAVGRGWKNSASSSPVPQNWQICEEGEASE